MLRYLILTLLSLHFAAQAMQPGHSDEAHARFMKAGEMAVSKVTEYCGVKGGVSDLMNTAKMLRSIRYQVAVENNSKDAFDFAIFRLVQGGPGNYTPLNSPPYRWLRSEIRSLLENHYNKNLTRDWIVSPAGISRYRIQILKSWEWPTNISDREDREMIRFPQLKEVDDPNKLIFDKHYFQCNFLIKGCVEITDEDFSRPLGAGGVHFDFTLRDKMIRAAKFPAAYPELRAFILHTEHRVGNVFLPGYSVMGTLDGFVADPIKSIQNSRMTLFHPPRCLVEAYFGETSKHWDQALAWDGKDQKDLMGRVGTFIYYWIITMPTVRGSASLGEWLAEGIYAHFGYKMSLDRTLWHSVDNAGFCHWTLDQFLAGYHKAIKLTPLNQH